MDISMKIPQSDFPKTDCFHDTLILSQVSIVANANAFLKKDKETVPPKTEEDLYDTIMAGKKTRQ